MLYGDQENPAVVTDGIGGVIIEWIGDSLYVSGSFELENEARSVAGTPAHIHTGLHGQNGPVAIPLLVTLDANGTSGIFDRARNGFAVSGEIQQALLGRSLYVNVHSEGHPSGEIRGQIVGMGSNLYFSQVSYDVPNVLPNPNSIMRMMVEKRHGVDSIGVSGSYQGWNASLLSTPLRPFFQINTPFTVTGSPGITVVNMPDQRNANNTEGALPYARYAVNVNARLGLYYRYATRAGWVNPANQVVLDSDFYHECKAAFYAPFTAAQAIPTSFAQAGRGDIITEYYTDRLELNGFVSGFSGRLDENNDGGLNISIGYAGNTEGALAGLDFVQFASAIPNTSDSTYSVAILAPDNIYNIDSPIANLMRQRGLHYNTTTSAQPFGELRAQITPRANALFHVPMAAGQALPDPGYSPAYGGLIIEASGERITISGSFSELAGGFNPAIAGGAHLHVGGVGETGPVRIPLVTSAEAGSEAGVFLPEDNTRTVSQNLLDTMLLRLMYANIHSQEVPSGELRGQVAPFADHVFHSKLSPEVTVPYTGENGDSQGTGALHAELFALQMILSGRVEGLSSRLDTSIAGGAHLHGAAPAQTGEILVPLTVELGTGDLEAEIPLLDNFFNITAALRTEMLNGDVYANFHTVDAPSGAVRGQVLPSINQFPDPVNSINSPADGQEVVLRDLTPGMVVPIEWDAVQDPDERQDAFYIWQLFADTSGQALIQTQISADTELDFLTVESIDSLLASLGVDSAQAATVYHRVWTTDGSLLTAGEFSEVSFVRLGSSSTSELPAGSARLLNTLATRDSDVILDIRDLPAGEMQYRILQSDGRELLKSNFRHAGNAQRYEISASGSLPGIYYLELRDGEGRSKTWAFVRQ